MSSVYRLSPNEQALLLHKKNSEQRKSRLIHVREQEKSLAKNVAERSNLKREAERNLLQDYIYAQTEAGVEAELRMLEEKYKRALEDIGQGQKAAQYMNDECSRIEKLRLQLAAKQRVRARERHAAALKQRAEERRIEQDSKKRALQTRKDAQRTEKWTVCSASQHQATSPHALVLDFAVDKGKKVKLKEVEGYSLSYYHIPDSVVERAGKSDQLTCADARQTAREAADRDAALTQRCDAIHQERDERSRLRYRRALEKVRLEKEKDRVLAEIGRLEREDRARRQRSLSRRPLDVFRPPQQRMDVLSEQQREMEEAFEGLCLQACTGRT